MRSVKQKPDTTSWAEFIKTLKEGDYVAPKMMSLKEYDEQLRKAADVNKDAVPKPKMKKKLKAKVAPKANPVPNRTMRVFSAKSMEDALKQLDEMGIITPPGAMLGYMEVK